MSEPIQLGPSMTVTFAVEAPDSNARRGRPGDTLCIERGAAHSFAVEGDTDASFLAIATPGVFGRAYFEEIAAAQAANGGVQDPVAFGAIMQRHGLTPMSG